MTRRTLRLLALASAALWLLPPAAAAPLQFNPVNPCRLVDTRGPNSPNGGPALVNRTTRSFTVKGNCGIPVTASAVALNVTVVRQTDPGHVTVWPSDVALPTASTLNFTPAGGATANGAIVPLAAATPDLSVRPDMGPSGGTVDLVLDVTGYFD